MDSHIAALISNGAYIPENVIDQHFVASVMT